MPCERWWSPQGMLVHLHDISSLIPLSRPIFNSEWIMSCKNILYVDSYCKSSYLCSSRFKANHICRWGHTLLFKAIFLSTADAATVVLWDYQHYLHIVLKIPLPMSILTFRGLSHVKMYEILSSSGKSKVEQCAIKRKSSLIWRRNQVCRDAILLDDILQLRMLAHEAASIFLQNQYLDQFLLQNHLYHMKVQ